VAFGGQKDGEREPNRKGTSGYIGNASNARSNDVNRPTVKCVACEVIHAKEEHVHELS